MADLQTGCTWQITSWDTYFEIAQSRKIIKGVTWVPQPIKHDSSGYRRVMQGKLSEVFSGEEIYCGFTTMVQVAMKCPVRGVLVGADGKALTPEDISWKTGVRAEVIAATIEIVTAPEIAWMDQIKISEVWSPMTDAPKTMVARSQDAPKTMALDDTIRRGEEKKKYETIPPGRGSEGVKTPTNGTNRHTSQADQMWVSAFYSQMCESLELTTDRALANDKAFKAVAAKLASRNDRDECLTKCVTIAREACKPNIKNRPAAWQKRVTTEVLETPKVPHY